MFFNSKKYAQEAEKNKKSKLWQEPSMFSMITVGLLASFAPTRPFLRMHKKRIEDHVTVERNNANFEQVPIIYFHPFRGGDYTTKVLVEQALEDKQNKKFL